MMVQKVKIQEHLQRIQAQIIKKTKTKKRKRKKTKIRKRKIRTILLLLEEMKEEVLRGEIIFQILLKQSGELQYMYG